MLTFTSLHNQPHLFSEGLIEINTPFTGNVLSIQLTAKPNIPLGIPLGYIYQYKGDAIGSYAIYSQSDVIDLTLPETDKIVFIPTSYLLSEYTLNLEYATVGNVITNPNATPLPESITDLPITVSGIQSDITNLSSRVDTIESDIQGMVSPTWDNLANKPSSFPPSTHTHVISDVINLSSSLDTIGTRLNNLEASTGSSNVLTANRTYFIRPDGNDSNNGLSDTGLGAFATLGRFYSELSKLTKNGFTVTCQLASGTYTLSSTCIVRDGLGNSDVIITGSTSNATDCVITGTNINLLSLQSIKGHTFQNLSFTYTGSTEYLSLITAKDSIFRLINVRFALASNSIGINLNENSICNSESLSFIGSGYVNIIANEASFNYKDTTAIDFSSNLSFASLQGEGGKFRFFNVDFNGSGTKSHWLRGYSKVVYKTGKSLSGDATNSLVIIT